MRAPIIRLRRQRPAPRPDCPTRPKRCWSTEPATYRRGPVGSPFSVTRAQVGQYQRAARVCRRRVARWLASSAVRAARRHPRPPAAAAHPRAPGPPGSVGRRAAAAVGVGLPHHHAAFSSRRRRSVRRLGRCRGWRPGAHRTGAARRAALPRAAATTGHRPAPGRRPAGRGRRGGHLRIVAPAGLATRRRQGGNLQLTSH